MNLFHRVLFLSTLIILSSCNFSGPIRNPASEIYTETDEPVALGQIKLSTIRNGFIDMADKSKMIEKVHHFEMDPVTRLISIDMTVNYPLEYLFNFTKIPDQALNDRHRIELAVSLPETKKLAMTRYLGLTFHKFTVDGDDYLEAFDIVASVVQTMLANSELIDFIATKIPEGQEGKIKPRELLREIIDSNGIVVFHTTKKINFKINLAMFSHLSPYIEEYENLRLWRLSPTYFQNKEVRFKLIAGEGKPSKKWMEQELGKITDDSRTLREVRSDLYKEFSDIPNVEITNKKYLEKLLANENLNPQTLRKNYLNEVNHFLDDLESRARTILDLDNENFVADPEHEYIRYTEIAKSHIRNYVSELDRRLSVDHNMLAGGNPKSANRPLVTKLISESFLNKAINFVTDVKFENTQIMSEASIHLLPKHPGLILKGRVHLPLKFVMGKVNQSLADIDLTSHIVGVSEGFPFELKLETKMKDNGVFALDVTNLKINSGNTKLNINKKSNNQQFLIDLTKIFLAQNLASMKFDLKEADDPAEAKQDEMKRIAGYLAELKEAYKGKKNVEEIIKSDLEANPFISAGEEYLKVKKEILIGDLIEYNNRSKMFEISVDPNVIFDEVAGVKHGLQLWGITPLYSKSLNNTYLEVAMGDGLRSQKYIDELYKRGGSAENSDFAGIYYDLGKEKSNVDILVSLQFQHINNYMNKFLADMVKANGKDAVQKAKDEPGETFYEINNIQVTITPDQKFHLDLKLKMAKMGRTFTSFWTKRELKEDVFTVNANLEIAGTEVDLNNNRHNIKQLNYYKSAISVNPVNVQIKSGRPSLVNSAITSILNSVSKLGLNNGTVRRLLMKVINSTIQKMYSEENPDDIMGHSMEKIFRLQVKADEILILLNPKVAGAAFDVHLANEKELERGIKLDGKNQTLHVALTGGGSVSKLDKVKLAKIAMDMDILLKPYLDAGSKSELVNLLKDGQLVGKLLTNSDRSKLGLYNKFKSILTKYDQVLHSTNIPHTSKNERTRISASGVELIYFAGMASVFEDKLKALTQKLEQHGLTSRNHYYPTYKDSLRMISDNIKRPLITQYEKKSYDINKTILNNKISYWTFSIYPNAYFADSIYEIIK